MPYIPNPADPTEPINGRPAGTAAAEFRALKATVAALIVAASTAPSVRQAIQSASMDGNGINAALTTGVGLRPGLTASAADPYHLSFAAGFTGGKAINMDESIVANNADILGTNAPASNTSYLYRVFGASYGASINPPYYAYAFDRSRGSILNFENVDGAVATTDDFGNTWTFNGNAQIDTAQFKFGTASLLLDGTGDFIQSNNGALNFGEGSWTAEMFVRFAALPTAGNRMYLYSASVGTTNSSGVEIALFNNAGTYNIELTVSSNASTANIANGVTSAITLPVINTWYHVVVTYDSLSATYRTYWDGTAENAVASAERVANTMTAVKLGIRSDGVTGGLNGWIDGFRMLTGPCLYPAGTAFVPPVAAPVITDYKVHFFSIPRMTMYEATAASIAAGVNPTLTAVNVLYLGEIDTSGAAVTAIRNYAIKGEFISVLTAVPAAANAVIWTPNIGRLLPVEFTIKLVNVIAENAWKPGQEADWLAWNATHGYPGNYWFLNGMDLRTLLGTAGTGVVMMNLTSAGAVTATAANWRFRARAKRAF